jgi:hypothetical protein
LNASDTERGWVAATLSRGATFYKNYVSVPLASGKTKRYSYPRVEFFSIDEADIDRLLLYTGYGNKTFRAEREDYGIWKWSVTRKDDVLDLALEIMPYLPEAKREKLDAALKEGQ